MNKIIEEIAIKVFSGQASAEEKKQLRAWLEEDPANRKLYLQLKNIWDIAHPAFPPEEIDVEEANTKVMSRIRKPKHWFRSNWFIYSRNIAAALCIPFLLVSAFLWMKDKSRPQNELLVTSMQEVFVPYGTYSVVTLPDSSKVWLNAGSSLQYPVRFDKKKREVRLKGEGYFEVKANPSYPFIVEAATISVEATGTAFNVETYEKDSLAAVTLIEGKVGVSWEDGQTVFMSANERLSFNNKTKEHSLSQITSNKWVAWKDGQLIFRNDPLEQVFKRIGQKYNIDIVVKDKSIAQQSYRATFENESLDEILRLLEMTAPIRYIDHKNSKEGDQYKKRRIEVERKR